MCIWACLKIHSHKLIPHNMYVRTSSFHTLLIHLDVKLSLFSNSLVFRCYNLSVLFFSLYNADIINYIRWLFLRLARINTTKLCIKYAENQHLMQCIFLYVHISKASLLPHGKIHHASHIERLIKHSSIVFVT